VLLADGWEAEESVGFSRMKAGEVVENDRARSRAEKILNISLI